MTDVVTLSVLLNDIFSCSNYVTNDMIRSE